MAEPSFKRQKKGKQSQSNAKSSSSSSSSSPVTTTTTTTTTPASQLKALAAKHKNALASLDEHFRSKMAPLELQLHDLKQAHEVKRAAVLSQQQQELKEANGAGAGLLQLCEGCEEYVAQDSLLVCPSCEEDLGCMLCGETSDTTTCDSCERICCEDCVSGPTCNDRGYDSPGCNRFPPDEYWCSKCSGNHFCG